MNNTSTPPAWTFELDHTQNWAFWDGAFSTDECRKIIEIGENKILEPATVGSDNSTDTFFRKSQVAWLQPYQEISWIFDRITFFTVKLNEDFFKFDLFGFIEAFQFTKYEAPGDFFGVHIDKRFNCNVRKLSITLQLSDPKEYEGGDLILHLNKKETIVSKEQGKIVAFPSYVLHEVKPVTKGTRYSLVAWASGKPFK